MVTEEVVKEKIYEICKKLKIDCVEDNKLDTTFKAIAKVNVLDEKYEVKPKIVFNPKLIVEDYSSLFKGVVSLDEYLNYNFEHELSHVKFFDETFRRCPIFIFDFKRTMSNVICQEFLINLGKRDSVILRKHFEDTCRNEEKLVKYVNKLLSMLDKCIEHRDKSCILDVVNDLKSVVTTLMTCDMLGMLSMDKFADKLIDRGFKNLLKDLKKKMKIIEKRQDICVCSVLVDKSFEDNFIKVDKPLEFEVN